MKSNKRLASSFFERDALMVAPELLGKQLIRQLPDGSQLIHILTEVEAYCGVADLACHASKGRTARTEVMYHNGGLVYVYLIYGMYWMLNFVTGEVDDPQAILIRGIDAVEGPGRVSKLLQIDKSFYGEDLSTSNRLWLCDAPVIPTSQILTTPRIGIDYAGEWKHKLWRFVVK